MTVAAVCNEVLGLVKGIIEVLGLVHCKHRRQLLMGELLRKVHALYLANEDLRDIWHIEARYLCDLPCTLAYDPCIERPVYEDGLPHLVQLLCIEEVASTSLEFLLHCIIDLFVDYDGLLGCAYHSVVERLGVDYGVHSKHDIRTVVYYCRGVSRSNTNGWLS